MSTDIFVHSEFKLDLSLTKSTVEGITKKFLVPYSIIRLCRENKDPDQELDQALQRIEDLESSMSKLTCVCKIMLEILKEKKAQVLLDPKSLSSIPSQDFLDSVKMELSRGKSREERGNDFESKNIEAGNNQDKLMGLSNDSDEETQVLTIENKDDALAFYKAENGNLRGKIKRLESKIEDLQKEVDDGAVRFSDLSKQLRRISVELDKEKSSHNVTIKELENYKDEVESCKKSNYASGSLTSYNLRCQATTLQGLQCKRNCQSGRKYCWQH